MKIVKYLATGSKNVITLKSVCIRSFQYAYIPLQIFLQWVMKLIPKKVQDRKYYVSLCLIFKDEARYLKEWIEYHKLIGVDHFYLYNNFSSDDYLKVLHPYIQSGIVTLIDWPHKYAQIEAYKDAYIKFKNETKWLGYIDTDEYVNIKSYNSIKDLLKKFNNYPSVYFHWRMFGTSARNNPPKNFRILENYDSCWSNLCNIGKTFINMDYKLVRIPNAHQMVMTFWRVPFFPVSMNKIPVVYFKTIYTDKISRTAYINHYWSKSYQEYYEKDFNKGDVSSAINNDKKKTPGRFEYHELNNDSKDYSIQRWLLFLNRKLDE